MNQQFIPRPPYYGQPQQPMQGQPISMYQQPVQPIPRSYPGYPYQEPMEPTENKSWKYILLGLLFTIIAGITFWFFKKRPGMTFNLNKSKKFVDESLLIAKDEEIASLKRMLEKQKPINGHKFDDIGEKKDLSKLDDDPEQAHKNFKKNVGLPGTISTDKKPEQTIDSFIDWIIEQRGFSFAKENQYSNAEIACKVTIESQGILIKIGDLNPVFRPTTEIETIDFRDKFDELISSASVD
ncbi:hypothetical protein [Emticicia sp. BO119]|uniref:hypothetical protein n=1 Tax=Emticicia sp. BO119 TaxID=2757768 RepID=UPI0015F0151B|nr:hypothetical protein [Emticicia sp. BO119]MBA4849011.1 hypothetical protein [Emticicia sp. BO119]